MRSITKTMTILATAFFTFNMKNALAETNPTSPAGIDLTAERVVSILTGLSCWFARIAVSLFAMAIVFYGIQIVLSRGNPEKFTSAKKSLGVAIIGGFVILGVYVIIATVANALGGDYRLLPLGC
jgi:hypothetical protein